MLDILTKIERFEPEIDACLHFNIFTRAHAVFVPGCHDKLSHRDGPDAVAKSKTHRLRAAKALRILARIHFPAPAGFVEEMIRAAGPVLSCRAGTTILVS